MSEQVKPVSVGQRFSQLYQERPGPVSDAPRARARLSGYATEIDYEYRRELERLIHQELGLTFGPVGDFSDLKSFLTKAKLIDFLDGITIVAMGLARQKYSGTIHRDQWVRNVGRVFAEQNLQYRIDRQGGVHPFVDEAFQIERRNLLAGLGDLKLHAAWASLNSAYDSLKPNGDGTLLAVRHSFDAVENVFKEKFSVSRLGDTEIKKKLTPLIEATYSGRAKDSAKLLLESFCKYVNAAHVYRHADSEKEPTPPPMALAVLLLTQSGSFLRWIIDFRDEPSQ